MMRVMLATREGREHSGSTGSYATAAFYGCLDRRKNSKAVRNGCAGGAGLLRPREAPAAVARCAAQLQLQMQLPRPLV